MSHNLYYNFILITLLYFATVDCKPLLFDYSNHTGVVGQLKVHNIPATWKDALMICDMEGAVLASPTSDAMKVAIADEMRRASLGRVFTGINSIYSKGYFFSVEGVPLADMPLQWLPEQPDNAGNSEDCIVFAIGSIADVSCSEVIPFVCYRQAAPQSSCLEKKSPITCLSSEFKCSWGGQCLPHAWRCDGEADCADGSDELDCGASITPKPGQCQPGEFRCSKHVCLPKDKRCDGHYDCLDGSDEVACNKSTNTTSSEQRPCYRFHSEARTWSEAYRVCAAEGSYLAVINSEREALRIKDDLETRKQDKTFAIFIGFHDWSGRGDWRTVHGQTLSKAGYGQWAAAGLKTRGERTCGALDRYGRLVSRGCEEIAPFLCERLES